MGRLVNTERITLDYDSLCTAELAAESACTDECEIVCIIDGSVVCVAEGREFTLGPRSLVVFPPMCYHTFIADITSPVDRYLLRFSTDALAGDVRPAFDSMISGGVVFFPGGTVSERVISAIERFQIHSEFSSEYKDAYLTAILTELICHIFTLGAHRLPEDESELGVRVAKYLNENMDKSLSLERLSARFFVSKYYLCRAFKKQNGVSIHSYVNHKRIMYAKGLIESGLTASEAAYKVGFGDYSAFYRAYVKIVGSAPTRDNRKEKI